MRDDFLQELTRAYETRDIERLKALAIATKRVRNKVNFFSSVLMLSCNNLKHLIKIPSLKADCIILNLEDGVSKEDKPLALVLCAIFLAQNRDIDKKLVVRVNALDEGGLEEILYLKQFMPDAIRVPKIKNINEVKKVLDFIDVDCELHLSIETKQAWLNMCSFKIDNRITTYYLGILDLFADMKLSHSMIQRDNQTMLYMLSHFLIGCRSIDVKAVSFVYQEFTKLSEFNAWINLEKDMGYDAKACISPKQVELVNKIFVNKEDQVIRAKEIIKLFENSIKNGISGFVDNRYGFIDEPIYRDALVLLENQINI